MNAQQLHQSLAALGDAPGDASSPEEKLRLLIVLLHYSDTLVTELAEEITSPAQTALFARSVEETHHRIQVAQIRAAHTAQRTLVTDLPAESLDRIRQISGHPVAFLEGILELPADPATVPTGLMPFKTTTDFLEGYLGITHFAAVDRLQAANTLMPHTDIYGNLQGPRYPKLAKQLLSGAVSAGPTISAAKKLAKLSPSIDAHPEHSGLAANIEEKIAESLNTSTPRATNKLFTAITEELDNETPTAPGVEEIRGKTGIFVTKRTRHYTHMSLCMLNSDAETFLSHFAQSDNPRTLAGNRDSLSATATGMNQINNAGVEGICDIESSTGESASRPDWFTHPDTSTELEAPEAEAQTSQGFGTDFNNTSTGGDGLAPPQRRLQTILNLMRNRSNSRSKGTTGLPTAQLIIHCHLNTLLGLAKGTAWSAHALEIPIGEVRRRLATDGVIPIVLGGQSEILDVGQEKRLAPDYMRRAVLARDGGCFYPNCTVPPEHCEMCHIDGYAQGGSTAVNKLVGGCTQHHHQADNGLLTLTIHNGLPHVILPKHVDPHQIPRRNTYWQQPQSSLF